MTNEQVNVKYVDLQGLRFFAEELKKWLKSHVLETDIYKELLYRIENLELYKIVDSLPETGDENTIYLLQNPDSGNKNIFIEYLYNNEYGWEEIGNFTPSFDLKDYLKIENAPFEKGDAENSAVLKGGNNKVTNANEVALGKYNISNSDTQFSIGIGTSENDADRKNAVEVKQNGDVYITGIGGYDGTNPTDSEDIASAIKDFVKISYAELVNLKSNSSLVPGRIYRIIDYVTTTKQSNTTSKKHPFDILVLALSESVLSERAWACHHESNTYFKKSHLEAWQIWYCLDNDTSRFAWADTVNGKGVIYRLIDEWNNDCPYDFKNILLYSINLNFCHTFGGNTDDSLMGNSYNNTIKPLYKNGKMEIGINIFQPSAYNNIISENCNQTSFGKFCFNNIIGAGCVEIHFDAGCTDNIVKSGCRQIRLGAACTNNELGQGCRYVQFGNYCKYNELGQGCNVVNIDIYSSNNMLGTCIAYCNLSGAETAAPKNQVQYYNIIGIVGTIANPVTIGTRGNSFITTVAVDSAGNVKQFCIADIIP